MEENELYDRIGETDLNPTYKDGQTYQHTDINQMLGILKTAINENYYDIQRLLNGEKTVGNGEKLDGASLSRYRDEELQADDNKVPSSQQAKAYMDALFAGYSAPTRGVDYWTEADQQQIVSDTANSVISEITPDLEEALAAKANINDIPTKISDLQNDSDFLSENNLQMVNTTDIQNGSQLTDATGYSRLNKIYGDTSQTGTPTPDNPANIDVVTGTINIDIIDKNLFDKNNYTNGYIDGSGVFHADSGIKANALSDYIKIDSNTNYIFSAKSSIYSLNFALYDSSKNFISRTTANNTSSNSINSGTASYFRVWCNINQSTNITSELIDQYELQLENGSTRTTYQSYRIPRHTLNLGDMELCKIGTYQDYIYKEGNNWYKKTYIGKIILDGSEEWGYNTSSQTQNGYYEFRTNSINSLNTQTFLCNKFIVSTSYSNSTEQIRYRTQDGNYYINILGSRLSDTTVDDFKTWLATNNVTVYYILPTAVNTQITDDILLTQLEATNIDLYENNNKFIITSSALLPTLNITYAITNRDFYSKEEANDLLNIMGKDLYDKSLKRFYVLPTNTQSEIQNIMNIKGAKVIEFETGNYNFSNSFRLNADTTLLLNNSTLTFSVQHGFFNFLSDDTFLEYNGNGNIKIVGGTIIGGNCSFCHARNIEFNNIHFLNCLNDHILEIASINNLVVDGCIFEGVVLQSESRNYVEYVQIDDMTRNNFPWFSDSTNITYDNTPNTNFEIKNNKFIAPSEEGYTFYTAVGGHSAITDKIHTNINIYHNVFSGNTNNAIRLRNVDKVNIFSNVFKNGTGSDFFGTIRFQNTVSNVNIESNNVDCNGNNTFIWSDTHSFNMNVVNNNVYNSYYPDDTEYVISDLNWIIFSYASTNLIISNNYFHNFNKGLLTINNSSTENSSLLFTNNNISTDEECKHILIRIYGAEEVIITNNIFDVEPISWGYIIRLFERTTKSIIKNNRFKSSHDYNYTRILDLNTYTGSLKEIEGIYFIAFTGKNTNTLTNQTLNYAYTDFNTLVLVCGTTNNTKYIKLKAFYPLENLDARTYKIPVVADDGTVGALILTLNSDGTVSGSTNVTGSNFRALYLIND